MDRRTKLGIITGALLLAGATTGMTTTAGDGEEAPLRGATYDKATAAALAHVGGGTVIETEAGDDGGAYEVEVRRPDGSVIEVSLDADFTVLNSTADDDAGETTHD